MVRVVDTVEVGVRVATSTLEVPAADKACIDVDVGKRDGAEFLKVEVEDCSVDRVQV